METFLYEFEWDPAKAQANLRKHGLDFEHAATVFLDPLALTIADEEQRNRSPVDYTWKRRGRALCAGGPHI